MRWFDGILAASDGNAWFWQRVRINGHLHPSFPFLFPLIGDNPVFIGCQGFGIWQLHGANQIFTEEFGRCFRCCSVVNTFEVVQGPRLPCCSSQGGRFFFLSRWTLQIETFICRRNFKKIIRRTFNSNTFQSFFLYKPNE